ncbi:hypothetical protein AcW1_007375 [Taiwanofungus camphoratus]|nr:hypothetical protein AcW2_007557 [Antrodia cinnamomea]KAI0953053.1 hypothetical protein AcW1_007375 [Antrodia cinnamomea]
MFGTQRMRIAPLRLENNYYLLSLWNDPSLRRSITNEYISSHAINALQAGPTPMFSANIEYNYPRENQFPPDHFVDIGCCSIASTNMKNRDGTLTLLLSPRTDELTSPGTEGREAIKYLTAFAFKSLGLHRLSVTVFDGDEDIVALYKLCGFVEEGRRRRSNWIDGEWHHEVLLGILEDEWVALPKRDE